MPHVDEGLLHAYLDGAFPPDDDDARAIARHFADCADCRARLEEARRLRDRAAVILADAVPPGLDDAPPFDELLARRAARTAPPPSHRRTARLPIPLAWAATLVVAIGAGWWAHELAGPAAQRSEGQALPVYDDAVPAAPATGRAHAADPAPRAVPGAATTREAEDRARVSAERAPKATVAAAPPEPGRIDPQEASIGPTTVAAAEPAAATARAVAPPANAPTSVAPTGFTAVAVGAAGAASTAPTAPSTDEALAASASAAPVDWQPLGPDDATRRIGAPLPHVPGLPVVETAVATVDGTRVFRIRQRLDGGDTLEILLKEEAIALDEVVVTGLEAPAADLAAPRTPAPAADRVAAAPKTAAPHPGPARRDAVVEVPRLGYRLTLRAPISADSLLALARRIP